MRYPYFIFLLTLLSITSYCQMSSMVGMSGMSGMDGMSNMNGMGSMNMANTTNPTSPNTTASQPSKVLPVNNTSETPPTPTPTPLQQNNTNATLPTQPQSNQTQTTSQPNTIATDNTTIQNSTDSMTDMSSMDMSSMPMDSMSMEGMDMSSVPKDDMSMEGMNMDTMTNTNEAAGLSLNNPSNTSKPAVVATTKNMANMEGMTSSNDDMDSMPGMDMTGHGGTFTTEEAWKLALPITVGILTTGLIIAALMIPVLRSKRISPNTIHMIVTTMIALAVGACLGMTLIHLLPEVFSTGHATSSSKNKAPKSTLSSLFIALGFTVFILFDWFFEWLGFEHSHCGAGATMTDLEAGHEGVIPFHKKSDADVGGQSAKETKPCEEAITVAAAAGTTSKKFSLRKTVFSFKGRKSTGFMVLLGDLMHNIMGGMVIGVTFASGQKSLAISTVFAILIHEIPMKISSMGLLIRSNFPIIQALACNAFVNLTALVGAAVGVGLGSLSKASNAYFLAFISGNFLYMALINMFPIVMKEKKPIMKMLVFGGYVLGVGLQFAIGHGSMSH